MTNSSLSHVESFYQATQLAKENVCQKLFAELLFKNLMKAIVRFRTSIPMAYYYV